jgi:hypothetical protein
MPFTNAARRFFKRMFETPETQSVIRAAVKKTVSAFIPHSEKRFGTKRRRRSLSRFAIIILS